MTDDDKLIDDAGNVDESELERRIRELGLDETPSIDAAREEAKKIDSEFEQRMKSLEDRAMAQKEKRDSQKVESQRQIEKDMESAKGLGIGLSVAYTIIGMPIVGILLGWLIDKQVGSQNFRTIGAIVGLILGIVGGISISNKSNRTK